ncbi:sensor histidine kinase [Uniformispora flossi]|uniref:sensor histidine kinase n=1 Tax=Uniformispora flossi TaxID=3390723 RepID=UPI003C2DEFA1
MSVPPLAPPLIERVSPRGWGFLDATAALVFALPVWGLLGHTDVSQQVAVAGTLGSALPIGLVRRHPGPAFALAAATYGLATATYSLTAASSQLAFTAFPGLALALYVVAVRHPGRTSVAALVLSWAAAVATALPTFRHAGAVLPLALAWTAIWAVGTAVGQRRRYAAAMTAHRADLAERGLAEERLRIARELHDVVAHSMSVITVQAGYGTLVLDERPEHARAALGAIETTGRDALVEMRRMLGVLRDQPATASGTPADTLPDRDPVEPAPGLAGLGRLTERTRQAGVNVALVIAGAPRPLPAGVDLCAYRIVQEALTNVAKHARTDRADVAVTYAADTLTLEITDRGRGPGPDIAPGRGLTGMRERVALCGGTLHADGGGGGFRVTAVLPLTGAETGLAR